jgi:hypothetical protein
MLRVGASRAGNFVNSPPEADSVSCRKASRTREIASIEEFIASADHEGVSKGGQLKEPPKPITGKIFEWPLGFSAAPP